MDEPGSKFLNPSAIRIDPSLGVVSSGTTEISPPAFNPDTGAAAMPPVVPGSGPATRQARQYYKFKTGGTLAERLGTSETQPTPEMPDEPVQPTRAIDVPERIKPRMSGSLVGKDMSTALKPTWEREQEPVQETPTIESVSEETTVPKTIETPGKANLKSLVFAYIDKFGIEKSAEFFGKTAGTITMWKNGGKDPPLSAAQLVLDKSSRAREQYLKVVEQVMINWQTGEGTFSLEHQKEKVPVDLCLVVKGDIPPYVMWVFIVAIAQYGIGFKMKTDTVVTRSRNLCAKQFLDGTAEWSIWVDADVLPTTGDATWWRTITHDLGPTQTVGDVSASYDFIKRFLSHQKPFVGGVYSTRRKGGPLVSQPDLHPRGKADKDASNLQRKNQAKGLLEVDWLSCGFAAIHRSVFEAVRKKYPEREPKIKGEPFPFFSIQSNEGEDYAFSQLARAAGFKLYLDQELVAGHLGRYLYLPGESAFNGTLDFSNA